MKMKARINSASINEDAVTYGFNRSDTSKKLRFIDLFCGIGGFRIGFEKTGAKCVFSSDWDKYSQITYEANFGKRGKYLHTF